MGRSQHHLRRTQHYDSSGYDQAWEGWTPDKSGRGTGTGTVYYVSLAGDDDNDGLSKQKPIKTIDRAYLLPLEEGDKVLFRGGDTFIGSIVAAERVTYGSYNGRATITNGAVEQHAFSTYNVAFDIENLNVVAKPASTGLGISLWTDDARHGPVTISNVNVSGFGNAGIGIGTSATSNVGYSDVLIEDCVVTGCGDGIKSYMSGGFTSIDQHRNLTVRNCICHGNPGQAAVTPSGSGIVLAHVNGGLIENCTAYNNGGSGASGGGGGVGIWTWCSQNVVIQYCESYENHTKTGGSDGGGFDLDGGCQSCTIQYCYSHDNSGAGFMLYAFAGVGYTTSNNTIRYNLTVNDANYPDGSYGGLVLGSANTANVTGTRFYNNTVYQSRSQGACIEVMRHGSGNFATTTIANNIFICQGGERVIDSGSSSGISGVTFSKNAYSGSVTAVRWNTTLYATVALSGRDAAAITSDPLLVNPGTYDMDDYQLQAGSPLATVALDVTSFGGTWPAEDLYGNPIPGSGRSIGAHQLVAG
jgi:hypothetical protein